MGIVDRVFGTTPRQRGERQDGFLPLDQYAALGDGRAVALTGSDGSIDWWCVPNMDSPPLFDRLLSTGRGGCFVIAPVEPFTVVQRYRPDSNVHETVFTTASGTAMLVESLNSGSAGRLPWAELARRVEGIEGSVRFRIDLRLGTAADTVSPYISHNRNGMVLHAGRVLALLRYSDGVVIDNQGDLQISGHVTVAAGTRETMGIVAGRDEPLVVPAIADIDARIDGSDDEWRQWTARIRYDGERRGIVMRSALALKLLLYSPSGAIAAAATTSLPEGVGGTKNWDYRYAWVRDAGYTIKAFLSIGAEAEAKAALTWLLDRIAAHGACVMYKLDGEIAPPVTEIDLPGYRGSTPVRIGNDAATQHQHGIYGDIFETAYRFVAAGNILDAKSGETLSRLADECADRWRRKDSGIWELATEQHYTMSKISCWQALARAVELADGKHLPTTCRDRWERERDRIATWIDRHCWSDARQAYVMHPDTDALDASLALAVRFGFDGRDRLEQTIRAIDRDLGAGAFHYRYSGAAKEEGCFLACTFWMIEAKALLGHRHEAAAGFDAAIDGLGRGCGIYAEMIDPATGEYLGNLPQGLTHLAIVQAAAALDAGLNGGLEAA